MSGPAAGQVAMTYCLRCDCEVPAGDFCGSCGCGRQTESVVGRRLTGLLRPRTFGAAPREGVLRPALASSLFPQLSDTSRIPFRVTLALAAAGLLGAALMRLPAAGIALGALGLPLLFVFSLRASAIDRDIPRLNLALAVGLGATLGALWVVVSGQVVARTYGVPMAVGLALRHLLREGFVIPTAGIALMVVPIIAIRVLAALRPPRTTPESLDGFVIGALAALAFTAAATLTRLAPQVAAGLIARGRPVKGLMVEAVLSGVTVPITAAAAGGMVGVALWFRQRSGHTEHAGRVRAVIVLLAVAALLMHAGVGMIDIIGVAQLVMLAAHVALTLVVLLALRVVLQLALLHETPDPMHADEPVLCARCDHVVPDMAFCPACGAAGRASSRQSRRLRRGPLRPRRLGPGEALPAGAAAADERRYPGYAVTPGDYAAADVEGPHLRWLLGRWGSVITAAAVALGATALVLTPRITHYLCPPDCGRPPTGTPVMALPRFESADGAFSVAYPAAGSAYTVATADNGVTATYTGGDGGVLQLFAEPARGRSARDVARGILKRTHPDASTAYEIPNAMVGYRPGYGEIADDWPQGSTAGYSRVRIVVMTAVKNDLALIAFATGPYHAYGPDFGPGPPSGANVEIALDMGKYVNSFRWRDDLPR